MKDRPGEIRGSVESNGRVAVEIKSIKAEGPGEPLGKGLVQFAIDLVLGGGAPVYGEGHKYIVRVRDTHGGVRQCIERKSLSAADRLRRKILKASRDLPDEELERIHSTESWDDV